MRSDITDNRCQDSDPEDRTQERRIALILICRRFRSNVRACLEGWEKQSGGNVSWGIHLFCSCDGGSAFSRKWHQLNALPKNQIFRVSEKKLFFSEMKTVWKLPSNPDTRMKCFKDRLSHIFKLVFWNWVFSYSMILLSRFFAQERTITLYLSVSRLSLILAGIISISLTCTHLSFSVFTSLPQLGFFLLISLLPGFL